MLSRSASADRLNITDSVLWSRSAKIERTCLEMVATDTIDEFVRTVLATKASLIESVVEGEGLGAEMGRDILTELEQLMRELSPQLSDDFTEELTTDRVRELLVLARNTYQTQHPESALDTGDRLPPLSDQALSMLIQVLKGSK